MSNAISYYVQFGEVFKTKRNIEIELKKLGYNTDFMANCKSPFYSADLGLHYPVVLNNTVVAYLRAQINKINSVAGIAVLDNTNSDLPNVMKSIKLLPQTMKAMQMAPIGQKICKQELSRYNWNHKEGMKIRPSEALKAMLLGYIEFPSEDTLAQNILDSCEDHFGYEYASRSSVRRSFSLSEKAARIDVVLNDENKNASNYTEQLIGRQMGSFLIRSSKTSNDDHVIKWRKPPKKSLWPWTLDHHWFETQESPITLANYTYKALLGNSNYAKRDLIDKKYPVFSRQLVMEHGRNMLECFFEGVVRDKKSKAWGNVCHTLDCMRWSVNSPYYAIPKLCLTLGVAPKFDDLGVFQKFVPLAGNISLPSRKVYVEHEALDVDNSHRLETASTSTLLLIYEFGLISLENLQKNTGITDAGAALGKDFNYIKVNIGKNVVCCIPKTFAYDKARQGLLRFQEKIAGQPAELEEAST
jgi:hypothetical protein